MATPVVLCRRALRRNDKVVCTAALKFLAHMKNQRVISDYLALSVAYTLLDKKSDDGVDMCVTYIQVRKTRLGLSLSAFSRVFLRSAARSCPRTILPP